MRYNAPAALVVRRVAASGAAEEITDRGRVVAILAPPPRTEGLERLRQAGAVRLAKQGLAVGTLPEIGLTDALKEQRESIGDAGRITGPTLY